VFNHNLANAICDIAHITFPSQQIHCCLALTVQAANFNSCAAANVHNLIQFPHHFFVTQSELTVAQRGRHYHTFYALAIFDSHRIRFKNIVFFPLRPPIHFLGK